MKIDQFVVIIEYWRWDCGDGWYMPSIWFNHAEMFMIGIMQDFPLYWSIRFQFFPNLIHFFPYVFCSTEIVRYDRVNRQVTNCTLKSGESGSLRFSPVQPAEVLILAFWPGPTGDVGPDDTPGKIAFNSRRWVGKAVLRFWFKCLLLVLIIFNTCSIVSSQKNQCLKLTVLIV